MYHVALQTRVKDRSAQRYLEALRRELSSGDISPVLAEWKQDVKKSIDSDFERGGDPRWKANRPSTVEAKGHSRVLFGKGGGSQIRDTIRVVVRRGSWRKASIGAYDLTEYGVFHREGRPQGWTIRAKSGEYLTFPIGDRWVKVKQVRHPGLPRRNYIVIHDVLVAKLREYAWKHLFTLRHSKR